MSTLKRESGKIEYPTQGYVLRWGERGVEIETTEYHATRLQITWEELCALAKRTGWKGEADEDRGKAGGKGRPTPPLI